MKILYFEASWCCQCKGMKPNFIKECQKLNFTNYEFLDADEHEDKVEEYGIKSLPTLIFLDENGNLLGKEVTANAYKEIEKYIK